MKWSSLLHGIAATSAGVGFLALVAAWIAGEGGTFIGLSQQHFFNDSIGLFLLSIATGIGTLIHFQIEK